MSSAVTSSGPRTPPGPSAGPAETRRGIRFAVPLAAALGLAFAALGAHDWRSEGWLWSTWMTRAMEFEGVSLEGPTVPAGDGRFAGSERHEYRGMRRFIRRGPERHQEHGPAVARFVENGRVAREELWSHGVRLRVTTWTHDGRVRHQRTEDPRTSSLIGRRLEDLLPTERTGCFPGDDGVVIAVERQAPPWWWGAEDQP